MSSERQPVILLVGADFHGSPEEEAAFNEWYTEVHAPYILELGASRAARYRLATTLPDELLETIPEYPMNAPRYLAIYEFEDRAAYDAWVRDGLPRALEQRRERWTDEQYAPQWPAAFQALTTFEKAA